MIAALLLALAQQRATPSLECRMLHPPVEVASKRVRTTRPSVVRIAFETDHELFQLLGSDAAVRGYVDELVGHASDLFCQQVDVRLEVASVTVYPTSSDPWTGTDTLSRFYEFAGNGPLPDGVDLSHFLSGAHLGGGVAYVAVLCNPWWGAALSANLTGNPVPGTWDFFVFAHELGHNFGSFHTHEYCPPLDRCGVATGLGCSPVKVCTRGTLMSYCHTCPGGVANVDPWFHPTTALIMRNRVAQSCLAGGAPCR